jgi:hypothetical protein
MHMTDPRKQTGDTDSPTPPRKRWSPPRVMDHGSLRWFVRQATGVFSDGSPGSSGGGTMAHMIGG